VEASVEETIPVVYLININPDLSRICNFCWAVLNFLGDAPILVGSKAYIDFQPQYHNQCYCRYLKGEVPAGTAVLTDGYGEFFDGLKDEVKDLVIPEKQPLEYFIKRRKEKDHTIAKGFAIGAFIGWIAAMREDKLKEARELIEKLIKRGWDDEKIIETVTGKYPKGEGIKALKEYGYALH